MLRVIRRLLPFMSIAVVLALAYVGLTFVSRWRANRADDRSVEAERAKANRQIVKEYGDGHLKILAFYPSPAIPKRGEKGLVCYGVANASAVRIEPEVEPVHPSLSRCVAIIAPARERQYTLTAQDAGGHTATQSFVLRVQ